MARASLSPVKDIATFLQIRRLIKKIRPDVVVPYTMKPIVYGGIAARSAGVPGRCFLVTGLGHVFSEASLRDSKGPLDQTTVRPALSAGYGGSEGGFCL